MGISERDRPGAGLAGCEAAWQLARRGFPVTLYEMKPQKFSPGPSKRGFRGADLLQLPQGQPHRQRRRPFRRRCAGSALC